MPADTDVCPHAVEHGDLESVPQVSDRLRLAGKAAFGDARQRSRSRLGDWPPHIDRRVKQVTGLAVIPITQDFRAVFGVLAEVGGIAVGRIGDLERADRAGWLEDEHAEVAINCRKGPPRPQ
jgi:hypothetical protein